MALPFLEFLNKACRTRCTRETDMQTNIFASFTDSKAAVKAVGALLDHGVRAEDVTLLAKDLPAGQGSSAEAAEKMESQAEHGITMTTPDDAKAGAVKGAAVGLGLGVIAAIAAVTLPGIGVVLGGGALAIAASGAAASGAAGALAGAATGMLKDQGLDANSAEMYSRVIAGGGSVVNVLAPSNDVDFATIRGVLDKYGAIEDDIRTLPRENVVMG